MVTLIVVVGLIALIGFSIAAGATLETSRQVHIASSVARDRRAMEERIAYLEGLEDLAKSARLAGVL